jgi:hypothetical protein
MCLNYCKIVKIKSINHEKYQARNSINKPNRNNWTNLFEAAVLTLCTVVATPTKNSATLMNVLTLIPGIYWETISSIPLFLGSLSILSAVLSMSGFLSRPDMEGFCIIDCIFEGSKPPYIIDIADFMKSGFCIIC